MQNPFRKDLIKKIVRAEATTNKIRIPKDVIDIHGRDFLFVYDNNTGVITLTPFN